MTQEEVLDFLKKHSDKKYTVCDLCRELHIGKAGMYRMVNILTRVKFIKKERVKLLNKNNNSMLVNYYSYKE